MLRLSAALYATRVVSRNRVADKGNDTQLKIVLRPMVSLVQSYVPFEDGAVEETGIHDN
jgi:hypothetical protein